MCIRDSFNNRRRPYTGRVPHLLCSQCSTYYDTEAGRESYVVCMKGKGRGKSGKQQQRRNPSGSDGNPMCPTC
eukprot:8351513-Prorocentrum_lima.AAC.1